MSVFDFNVNSIQAALVPMAERLICNEDVIGSSPISGTTQCQVISATDPTYLPCKSKQLIFRAINSLAPFLTLTQ